MTPPPEYQRATDHFYAFLADVREIAGFTTMNPAYTTTQDEVLSRLPPAAADFWQV